MTSSPRGKSPRSVGHRTVVSLAIAAVSGLGVVAVAAPALASDYPPAPPECTVVTSSDTPNSPVTVTGIGFTPGSTVTVGATGSGLITTPTTVAAGDGSVSVTEGLGAPGTAQFTLSGTPTSATCSAYSSVTPTSPPTTAPPTTAPPTTAPPTDGPTPTPSPTTTHPTTTPSPTTPAKTSTPSTSPSIAVKGLDITRPRTPVKLVVQPVGALAYTGTSHIGAGIDIGMGLIIVGAGAVLIARRRSAA